MPERAEHTIAETEPCARCNHAKGLHDNGVNECTVGQGPRAQGDGVEPCGCQGFVHNVATGKTSDQP